MRELFLKDENWLSWEWFSPQVLLNFQWEHGIILYALPVVPFIYFLRWLFHFNFRQKLDIALPPFELKRSYLSGLLRFVPTIFFILFLAMVLVSLARPQKTSEKIESFTKGIDIIFALDISESMLLEDFSPNRLESAKKIIHEFIKSRTEDRMGIVVFSGAAYTLVPLSTDEQLLLQSLDRIDPSVLDTGATAIGNAIAVSINRLNESSSGSKVLILLTDGENTSGNIGPETAAQLAYAYNIKIFTVGIGQEGSIPYGKDANGKTMYVSSSLNENLLQKIAQISKGNFYKAGNEKMLRDIFTNINMLEKGRINETRFKDSKDYYQIYLTWGLIFFILWMLAKSTFLTNALED
jgi:Ca-activated chloride channel family protein